MSTASRDAENARIEAAISARLRVVNIPEELLARGQSIIVLDDQGRMVRKHPDGTTVGLTS